MDLNYLLLRHQVSLMRADNALSSEARCAHNGLAKLYAQRIRTEQRAFGAATLLLPA